MSTIIYSDKVVVLQSIAMTGKCLIVQVNGSIGKGPLVAFVRTCHMDAETPRLLVSP